MRYWNLSREVSQLQRELDNIFRSTGFGREFGRLAGHGSVMRDYPSINLREDEENIFVEALLPGIDPKQLEISMLGNTLTISGSRPGVEDEKNGRTWHRRERSHGTFMRTLELPAEVNASKVKAESQHGLLRVTLPKAVAQKPKKIAIKVR